MFFQSRTMEQRPYSWEELYEYALNVPRKKQPGIPRTKEVEEEYMIFKIENPDFNKYILSKYLFDRDYVFAPNRFPYHTVDNVLHYLLWFRPGYKISPQIVKREVHKIFPGHRFVAFINYPEFQSVPGVPHYHVFIKR